MTSRDPRLIANPDGIVQDTGGYLARLTEDEAHHGVRVLRLRAGDPVLILDGTGLEYPGRVTKSEIGPDGPVLEAWCGEPRPAPGEPAVRITLIQALPKGDKMDLVIQKGTEVGVSLFQPVVSERVVVEYRGAKAERRLARWNRIAAEAAKQAARGVPPRVLDIGELLETVEREAARKRPVVVLWEGAKQPLRSVLGRLKREAGDTPIELALAVGPEGGFAPKEADAMRALGADLVTLGSRILRTETAGPVGAALVLYELEN